MRNEGENIASDLDLDRGERNWKEREKKVSKIVKTRIELRGHDEGIKIVIGNKKRRKGRITETKEVRRRRKLKSE